MTKVFWIMLISTGFGHSQTFDSQRFETEAECRAAKIAIVEATRDWWQRIGANDVVCIEVRP